MRNVVLAGCVCLIAGLAIGRWSAPERVEYRDRVVTKTVEVERAARVVTVTQVAEAKTRTRWRTRIIVAPDGTRTEERDVVTGTDTNTDTRGADAQVVYRDREVAVEKVVTRDIVSQRDWLITGTARVPWLDLDAAVYGAQVQRRIIGPVYAGVSGDTSGAVGVAVTVAF